MPYTLSSRQKKHLSAIARLVGRTPLYPIRHAYSKKGVTIHAKLEWNQLAGSVKSRAAFNIIREALESSALKPGQRLIDSTSGNTGISYAAIGARLGIPVTILMSETASRERSTLLKALGAEIIYTPEAMTGDQSIELATKMAAEEPEKYFFANQFGNDANWKAHFASTGPEILHQTKGRITHFAAAMGTTGTLMGTGRFLREKLPGVSLVQLQPDAATHTIEGWKYLATAKAPGIYDPNLAPDTVAISTEEAHEWVKRMARLEGMLISPSSAAALAGAVKVAESISSGVVVTVFPDSADKYGAVLEGI